MRLSMLVIIGSAFDGALAQRKKRPNKNRPNRQNNKKPQQPRLIPVPMQEEPGFADNRQDIANMLAFKLSQYGYNRHWDHMKRISFRSHFAAKVLENLNLLSDPNLVYHLWTF